MRVDRSLREVTLASNLQFVAALGAMLSPVVWSLIFCLPAWRLDEPVRAVRWPVYVQRMRGLNLLAVPAWWSLCNVLFATRPLVGPISGLPGSFALILPLTFGIVAGRLVTSWIGRKFDSRHWTTTDPFGFALWRSLSSTVPLLMFAAGVDAIDDLSVAGIFWIVSAAILALFARTRLRAAEGFKPRPVKSGALFKQSFAMAQRMGIPLKGIFVVPAGRGRLMNAFSLPGYIGMTDICVHRIKGAQREFFIGHELAHNRLRHGWKKVRIIAGIYLIAAALSFVLPHLSLVWQILLRFGQILIPLMVSNTVARRFEFAADRAAVELTDEPEAAIRALGALYFYSGVPTRRGNFQELFLTHPSLEKRIDAIARVGNVSVEKLVKIRQQFDHEAARLAESI